MRLGTGTAQAYSMNCLLTMKVQQVATIFCQREVLFAMNRCEPVSLRSRVSLQVVKSVMYVAVYRQCPVLRLAGRLLYERCCTSQHWQVSIPKSFGSKSEFIQARLFAGLRQVGSKRCSMSKSKVVRLPAVHAERGCCCPHRISSRPRAASWKRVQLTAHVTTFCTMAIFASLYGRSGRHSWRRNPMGSRAIPNPRHLHTRQNAGQHLLASAAQHQHGNFSVRTAHSAIDQMHGRTCTKLATRLSSASWPHSTVLRTQAILTCGDQQCKELRYNRSCHCAHGFVKAASGDIRL